MTRKQKLLAALKSLPADASYEDAMERLIFLAKIEEGIKQADAGQTISHRKVKQQMGRWLNQKHRASLAQLLKGITKENSHPEIDWGPPVGREIW